MLNNFLEIFRYKELIKNLVGRDLKVRYKSSLLGFAWTWLDPLLTRFIFIIVFDFILGTKIKNSSVFLLTGLIPWTFFNNSINGSVNAITGNETFRL
jgi:ABC-2 type transport system permease protein